MTSILLRPKLLTILLSCLKAVAIQHQHTHWVITGPSSYSDHLLLERLYDAIAVEVDALAERIIGLDGYEIDLLKMVEDLSWMVDEFAKEDCPVSCSMRAETILVSSLKYAITILENDNLMTPGLDDLLSSMVSQHEEHLYLLGRRIKKAESKKAESKMERPQITQRIATRTMTSESHEKSVALMKFLSSVATGLGIGDHVYVVGGAVRNFVIERPIKDIDVMIDSLSIDPEGNKDSEWFAKELASSIPAQTSLQTNQYGVAILTVSGPWEVDGRDLQGEVIEIANALEESYGGEEGKGYKPSEVGLAPIEKDIERREFTFNTLMWQLSHLAQGPDKAEIIDLTGCGLDDLEEGVMRCPSDPDKTFSDDPTRMLRAVKFLVKYGFTIDPLVADAIRRNAGKLKKAPQNAISSILIDDILNMSQSKETLKVLKELGLLDVVASMLEKDKAFRSTLLNWAQRDAKVFFLFDMMDIGLPLAARIRFLDQYQMDLLRTVTIQLGSPEAGNFVNILKQPGKVMDTKALIKEFGIQGPDIRLLMESARTVLLKNPDLRNNGRSLTKAVRLYLQKIAA